MAPQSPKPTDAGQLPADSADPMGAAIAAARRGLAAGEPPVGACLVQDGEVLAVVHNGVVAGPDPTAHAEILAIREACRKLRSPRLDGAVLYSTVEPCAMCLAACQYAGIDHVVYGASLADFAALTGREFRGTPHEGLRLTGGVAAGDCLELVKLWVLQQAARRRSS